MTRTHMRLATLVGATLLCSVAATRTPTLTLASNPGSEFLAALRTHCGKAYAGRIINPQPADSAMLGQLLVMHVRGCGDTVRVPFHVGTDRSRTWVFTTTATGARLKHDHRHEDGTDAIGEVLDGGAAALRIAHEADDLGQHTVRPQRGRAIAKGTGAIDGAADDGIAHTLGHRH